MVFDEKLKLSNGVMIPQFGLGTWFIDDCKAAEHKTYESAKHGGKM